MAALTSEDGKFMCTPDHAVEVAYLISTAEGWIMENPSDALEVAGVLLDYMRGDIGTGEAIKLITDPDG